MSTPDLCERAISALAACIRIIIGRCGECATAPTYGQAEKKWEFLLPLPGGAIVAHRQKPKIWKVALCSGKGCVWFRVGAGSWKYDALVRVNTGVKDFPG